MNIATVYRVLDTDSVNGYTIQVTSTFSTFDVNEFVNTANYFQQTIGNGQFVSDRSAIEFMKGDVKE